MAHLRADARLAFRSWRKSPGFFAIAVLSIALGIGATTAIFALVDHVLLRVLPIQNPDELAQVTFTGSRYGSNWGDGSELSYPMYTEIKDRNDVFSGTFARFNYAFHIGQAGRTERVAGELVSGTYFNVLGVGAAIGRVFTADDDRQRGGHPVAVLSHAFWMSGFGGDPAVLNSTLTINGHPYTVIGVAQPGFEGVELGRPTRVFAPLMMKAQLTPGWDALDERLYRWVRVFARLRPGVTREQAQTALQPHFRSLLQLDLNDRQFASASKQTRDEYLKGQLEVIDASQGRSGFRRAMTTPLWVLMATAVCLLLIACANIANLLIARGAARQREVAVRLAVGATRGRVIKQLLVESVMLAAAGGAAGLVIAYVGAPFVLAFFIDPDVPAPISTTPDWRIVAFTFAVSTATGVLFGLAPALQSTRPDLAPTLKAEAGSVAGGHARYRKSLVAVQITLSFLLVTGAVLFIRTLDNLLAVDIGFNSSGLLSFGVDPSLNGYDAPRTRQFVKSLLERLNATPGVEGVGIATQRLLEGNQWNSGYTVEGYQAKPDENVVAWNNAVSPGYFNAMGIPVLLGRDFNDRDERTTPAPERTSDFRVAIANERFVKTYFGTANPIGRRIGFGTDPNTPTPIEIVGVVRDSKYTDVRDEVQRQLFFPYLESSRPGGFTVYLRTRRPSADMFAAARKTVQQLDPNIPVHGTRTLERQIERSLRRERLVATMTSTFGAVATVLAIVGLYGVMSYTVARRTREIGVRVAFGARSRDIGWLVLREVLQIGVVGVAIGVPIAWALGRYVSAQLYGVEPTDAGTFVAASVLLLLIALGAGLAPSIRAARLDPTAALRQE